MGSTVRRRTRRRRASGSGRIRRCRRNRGREAGPGAGGSCSVWVGARMIGGGGVGRARSGTGDEARVGEGKRAGFGGLATTTAACGYAVAFRGTGAVGDECGARPVSRQTARAGWAPSGGRLRTLLGAPRLQ